MKSRGIRLVIPLGVNKVLLGLLASMVIWVAPIYAVYDTANDSGIILDSSPIDFGVYCGNMELCRSICQLADTGQCSFIYSPFILSKVLLDRFDKSKITSSDMKRVFGMDKRYADKSRLTEQMLKYTKPNMRPPYTYNSILPTDDPEMPVSYSIPWNFRVFEVETDSMVFHNMDGTISPVKFLCGTFDSDTVRTSTLYYENDDAVMVKINFYPEIQLDLIVPKRDGVKPVDCIESFKYVHGQQIPVFVALPAVSFNYSDDIDLAEVMKKVGVESEVLTAAPIRQYGQITFGKTGINEPSVLPEQGFGRLPVRSVIADRPFYFQVSNCYEPFVMGTVNSLRE